ncbi:unnamed protein product [Pleuronectes platessa]|uniref:Uncharacterized protein n=1 Tax=Pleuronectes platessa TaxID=8262 RepID=A0A9N7UE41_PLEPL|nr:unnamed protein product [Pleuronectes platessa]
MSMFDPGERLPEEQDYVKAYESVREKYKGGNLGAFLWRFNREHPSREETEPRARDRLGRETSGINSFFDLIPDKHQTMDGWINRCPAALCGSSWDSTASVTLTIIDNFEETFRPERLFFLRGTCWTAWTQSAETFGLWLDGTGPTEELPANIVAHEKNMHLTVPTSRSHFLPMWLPTGPVTVQGGVPAGALWHRPDAPRPPPPLPTSHFLFLFVLIGF